jgi:hypothetical protein
MPQASATSEPSYGYLSILQTQEHGYFGGYLIVSALGRPMEFHCTSPVRPSRAQEILYGPTLQPYLVGEQIGGALLAAATTKPEVIVTDQAAALEIRSRTSVPLVFVRMASIDSAEIAQSSDQVTLAGYALEFAPGFESDRTTVMESLAVLTMHVDLSEPFGRIHEAIREAQRIGGRTSEGHGQAA